MWAFPLKWISRRSCVIVLRHTWNSQRVSGHGGLCHRFNPQGRCHHKRRAYCPAHNPPAFILPPLPRKKAWPLLRFIWIRAKLSALFFLPEVLKRCVWRACVWHPGQVTLVHINGLRHKMQWRGWSLSLLALVGGPLFEWREVHW